MKRWFTVGAMVALALACAGCSGCTTTVPAVVGAATSGQAVMAGQKIDEQVLGGVYALGSSANVLILAAVNSGALSHHQLLLAEKIRADLDAGTAAAQAAYNLGDAATFNAKVAAVADLNKQATALFYEVKS